MSNDRLNKSKIRDLTNKWYDKLKKSGFEDIEFYDSNTGYGQNADYLKHSAAKMTAKYSTETAQHYRICTNFTTHYQFPNKKHKFIFNEYCNGTTFREILRRTKAKNKDWVIKRNGRPRLSLFSLHHLLKRYIKLAYDWNKTHPEGIMLQSDTAD
jgi:hypothetical protein